jgi:hypothetical protein
VARVLDIRGEEPQALQALSELCTRRERWEELVEIIERQVAVAQRIRTDPLYKRLGQVWEDKLSASATPSMRGSPPTASTATTSRRCAPWRSSIARRRRGTSCPDAPPHHRRRPADGAISETETIELYASSVSSKAKCSAASTTRSRRGAA